MEKDKHKHVLNFKSYNFFAGNCDIYSPFNVRNYLFCRPFWVHMGLRILD